MTLPRLWIAALIAASNFAIAVPIAELALLNESGKLTVLGLLALIPVRLMYLRVAGGARRSLHVGDALIGIVAEHL